MTLNNSWIKAGALLGASAVLLGAFGAHLLDEFLVSKYGDETREFLGQEILVVQKYLDNFKTAAHYQLVHAVVIALTGTLYALRPRKSLKFALWSFFIGVLLFSGSLYALVFTGIRILGAVTPIGGVLLIVGWIALVEGACPGGKSRQTEG